MTWREKYMKNMVRLATLERLVAAGKLERAEVDAWQAERLEAYGY